MKSKWCPPVELLAGHAGEVELVAAEPAVLSVAVAVIVQLPLRVAAQDVPRGVERRRMRPERAVDGLGPAIFSKFIKNLNTFGFFSVFWTTSDNCFTIIGSSGQIFLGKLSI